MLAVKDKQYKILEQQFKNLNDKHDNLLNKIYLLEKQNEDLHRKLAINDNHVHLENIFSKLSSLILATKADEDLNLDFKERRIIKELFGGKNTYLSDNFGQSQQDEINMTFYDHKLANNETDNEFTDDEAILNNLAESFIKHANTNSHIHRSKSG